MSEEERSGPPQAAPETNTDSVTEWADRFHAEQQSKREARQEWKRVANAERQAARDRGLKRRHAAKLARIQREREAGTE